VDGVDVGLYGSRGQQRLVVLALKLAETQFLTAETGEVPILLLDDVPSELDSRRRRLVLGRVASGGQVLATATEADLFPAEFLAAATLYRVQAGTLETAASPP
jgi:DNA replication and repair protein RecF